MKRVFEITAFRNIGFKDGKPYASQLVLGNSTEHGRMGELLVLVGANNSGKSNVLDALERLGELNRVLVRKASGVYGGRIQQRERIKVLENDKNSFFLAPECKFPKLELHLSDKVEWVRREEKAVAVIDGIRVPMPQILTYTQKYIVNEDFALRCGLDPFGYSMKPEISAFFERLFNAIKVSPQEAVDAYKNFRHFQDKKYLVEFQEMVNDKLQSVSDIFNRMYFLEDVPFSFKVEVERIGIFLTIHRGKVPVRLEQQSTGFRYFFDMFFNLLCTTELKPGTILIMDEPAANLHVKGQRELRAFLKEFALLNDITIIVATHSPFLVDLDNLDELRVVVGNNDGTSRIVNDFTAVDPTDPDTLRPIKEALTVENYMLVNPKETVVFVSSLAEYNLLVAFKKLLRKEGISFLPFNLGGADQQSCMEASKGLQKIRSDAFVIVPDDEAGQLMKSLNDTDTEGNSRSDLEVIFWNEIDTAFGTVNSLLSGADQNQLFPKGIDSSSTSVFKNHILEYEAQISEETRENFQKLFHRFD